MSTHGVVDFIVTGVLFNAALVVGVFVLVCFSVGWERQEQRYRRKREAREGKRVRVILPPDSVLNGLDEEREKRARWAAEEARVQAEHKQAVDALIAAAVAEFEKRGAA